MVDKYSRPNLFDSRIVQASYDLFNLELATKKRLIGGAAAGIRQLQYSQFPPDNVHSSQVPAKFSFKRDDGQKFELMLMMLVVAGDAGNVEAIGFIANRRRGDKLFTSADIVQEHYYAAVRYSPTSRNGYVYLYNDVWDLINGVSSGQ